MTFVFFSIILLLKGERDNMKRLKYYIQRLKGMEMKNLKFAINGVHQRSGKNRLLIFLDMCYCMVRYSAGYMDYYY